MTVREFESSNVYILEHTSFPLGFQNTLDGPNTGDWKRIYLGVTFVARTKRSHRVNPVWWAVGQAPPRGQPLDAKRECDSGAAAAAAIARGRHGAARRLARAAPRRRVLSVLVLDRRVSWVSSVADKGRSRVPQRLESKGSRGFTAHSRYRPLATFSLQRHKAGKNQRNSQTPVKGRRARESVLKREPRITIALDSRISIIFPV